MMQLQNIEREYELQTNCSCFAEELFHVANEKLQTLHKFETQHIKQTDFFLKQWVKTILYHYYYFRVDKHKLVINTFSGHISGQVPIKRDAFFKSVSFFIP